MAAPVPALTFPAKRILLTSVDAGLSASIVSVPQSVAARFEFSVAITPRYFSANQFLAIGARIAISNGPEILASFKKVNSRIQTLSIAQKQFSSFPSPYFPKGLVTTRPIKGTLWPRLAVYGSLKES